MSELFSPSLWSLYTKKMVSKIESLPSAGSFSEQEAKSKNMHLLRAKILTPYIELYILIDEEDRLIADIKYQAMVNSLTLALLELMVDLTLGNSYAQAQRITPEALFKSMSEDKQMRIPWQSLQESLESICGVLQLALASGSALFGAPITSLPAESGESQEYPDWLLLDKAQKLAVIEEVFNKEIRPYVALDEGGVEILDIVDENEVVIAYQGACTSCYSSVGSTLSAIQQILQEKIHKMLTVTPQI